MIQRKLYQLDTSHAQWQVAHLFEHLVIRGYYELLKQRDIRSEGVVWITGETFEDRLYIDAGFYDTDLLRIFETYTSEPKHFTDENIEFALATMSAEDRITLTVIDKSLLHRQLKELDKSLHIQESVSDDTSIWHDTLHEQKAAKHYRDITVVTHFRGLDEEEQKLLLRLYVFFIDINEEAVFDLPGIYHKGTSILAKHGDEMAFVTIYAVHNDHKITDLKKRFADITFTDADILALDTQVSQHLEGYASEQLWRNMPVEYYRNTGIATTTEEIAGLYTTERLRALYTKVSRRVRVSTEHDQELVD